MRAEAERRYWPHECPACRYPETWVERILTFFTLKRTITLLGCDNCGWRC